MMITYSRMNRNMLVALTIIIVLLLSSCTKDTTPAPTEPTTTPTSIIIEDNAVSDDEAPSPDLSTTEPQISFQLDKATAPQPIFKPNIDQESVGYSLMVSPAFAHQEQITHMVHVFYGDHQLYHALTTYTPDSEQLTVHWSDYTNIDNINYNSFMRVSGHLFAMDEQRLLFLQTATIDDTPITNIAAWDASTQTIEVLRENFWPNLSEDDYIYNIQWDQQLQRLFIQSYLGNVWLFDFKSGQDIFHEQKFRVIPHSTMGVNSLFPAPTFEQFAFNDESGEIAFYHMNGKPLRSVTIGEDRLIGSESVLWSDDGSFNWIGSSDKDEAILLGIDIDYLLIAPQKIDFYDHNGQLLQTLTAKSLKVEAIEVVEAEHAVRIILRGYQTKPVKDNELVSVVVEESVQYFTYNLIDNELQPYNGKNQWDTSFHLGARQYDIPADEHRLVTTISNKAIVYGDFQSTINN